MIIFTRLLSNIAIDRFKRGIPFLLFISLMLYFPLSGVWAGAGSQFESGGDPPELDPQWFGEFFKRMLQWAFPIAVLVASGVIVYGGYMWIMSSGDPGKLKQAQGTLTWGIIGLVFLGIIGMILQLVFDFFF